MAYFGEDVVVSLGKYFWIKIDKAVMKKGTKRMREGTLKQVPDLNKFISKSNFHDIKQGALDTTTTMGYFARANYYSVSQLNKYILDK